MKDVHYYRHGQEVTAVDLASAFYDGVHEFVRYEGAVHSYLPPRPGDITWAQIGKVYMRYARQISTEEARKLDPALVAYMEQPE